MSRNIDIGVTGAGAPAIIDLEELLATRLLVQGNSGSGKSHLLRRLLEQSAGLVQQIVIDPEGDFISLAERYGHLALDAAECERDLAVLASRVRAHRVSVVLNLENLEVDGQMRCAAQFLNALFEADRELWFPALVVVDEAQVFAPAAASDSSEEARRISLAAMTNLMCRGRKRGLAGVIATQRLAKLAKNVAAEASNFLMGRTFLDIDMARAADLLGMERRQAEAFRDLERGSFIGLGPAIARRPSRMRIGTVETADRGGAPKLLPLPGSPDEATLSLIFAPTNSAAPTPRKPAPRPERLQELLTRIEHAPCDMIAAPLPELTDGEREATIDEILRQMLADENFASQPAASLHRDFLLRCRIRRLGARTPDLQDFRRRMTVMRARMAFSGSADEEAWSRAIAVGARLPEDLACVFLYLGRAAVASRPCPSDEEIARFFGSHSPGRARRMIGQLEQADLIVARMDFQQRRIISFPELGLETSVLEVLG
ncbi:helicase HerA domain-containing protein [Rhodoblastus sp.]|uniref:helicase HerA domain-containing protein n=1 Tax=Rhodoblastus sp. TaxID=1962975 RepID=UPI003F9C842C